MRILHISTRLILGGSQENTVLSCEGQARLGHEVHLAFGPIFGPEGSLLDRVRRFRTDDARAISAHEIANLVREVSPLRDRRGVRELESLIETLCPDVVHTHSSKAGVLGREAAWRVRRRTRRVFAIVHTVHGPPFMPLEGNTLRRARTRLLNAAYTLAERRAARRCDVIVSVADAMTRVFRSRGIGRDDQFVTVRSGMETDAFLTPRPGESRDQIRASLGLAPDAFVIGTIARLAQHKGHDDLLDALGEDLKAHPEWTLLWVGDGWWRDRLVARVRAMGLSVRELDRPEHTPGRLVITGLVPPARIPGLLRAMDVLAHPSSREGLPRTVPQAILAGVCPVAYDADGTREACREMRTGRLVPVGDTAALRRAITWCAQHPMERAALAAAGREECREAFSAETMVGELEKVYAAALRNGQS